MSDTIRVVNIDSVYNKIEGEDGLVRELADQFTFFAKNHKFNPKFKAKVWDGKIRLLSLKTHKIYYGLYPRIQRFCAERGYKCELDDTIGETEFSVKEAEDFIKSLNLSPNIKVRDYQLRSFIRCIRGNRKTVLSPTGSGKSFIIYLLTRYYKRTLIVGDRTNLVDQMVKEFEGYGSKQRIHKIYQGQDKNPSGYDVVVSTWQSIFKNIDNWFNYFDCIIVDEAHTADADSLTTLMKKTPKTKYKFGFTATLKDAKVHRYTLEGLFGPVIKAETTRNLQKRGYLSPLLVKIIVLRYPDEDRKLVSGKTYKVKYNDGGLTKTKDRLGMTYQKELEWCFQDPKRNRFLKNLALSLKGNSMILFRYVDKHGVPLYNSIKESADYPVYYVAGEVEAKDREEIRNIVETHDRSTTVASSGVFSTGVNIVNLHNIVSAAPFKSRIRVLQSIGRGLRKTATVKEHCTWYDIVDDLAWKGRKNYGLEHLYERIRIYEEEGFDYKIYYVNLK